MAHKNILAGLDVGSTKVCCAVAESLPDGGIQLLGLGTGPCEGLERGSLVNLEATVDAIDTVVEEAGRMAGLSVREAYVGISGDHARSVNSRGAIGISRREKEVVREDIERVLEGARAVKIPSDRELLHSIPRGFTVDDQPGIRDPLGMSCVRLEAEVHIVTVASTPMRNLERAISRAGLSMAAPVLGPLAAALSVLEEDERKLGVALVDIGGGTTDIAIFHGGMVEHTAVLGVGGGHVTQDVAIGLRTPNDRAEELKLAFGCALASLVSPGEVVEVPGVGGRSPRQVSRQVLAAIIEPRAEEILSMALREIERRGMTDLLAAGIVLTGGTALLPGLVELSERLLGVPARIGRPRLIEGLTEAEDLPQHAEVLGLLWYGAAMQRGRAAARGGSVPSCADRFATGFATTCSVSTAHGPTAGAFPVRSADHPRRKGMLDMDTRRTDPARIAVIGLGGGGSNAVNRMIADGLRSVTFWVANTDLQALENASCPNRLQLGVALTGGLGAGGDPEIGRAAAEEDQHVLAETLEGFDMVFLTAGMGGGTGTGAAPIVARLARSLGALTVAIVTRPFLLEGSRRLQRAEEGIRQLAEEVDTLIVIPNDKLLHLVDRTAGLESGLRIADGILFQATRGIADIITGNGIINVDFADVRTVMRNRGAALLGCGIASGSSRASDAAQLAVSSPLLEDLSIDGAQAVLVNIVGGPDMGFHEVTEAAKFVTDQAGKDCDVFLGAVVDPNISGEMRVTLIATGFERTPAIRKIERPASASAPEPSSPVVAPIPEAIATGPSEEATVRHEQPEPVAALSPEPPAWEPTAPPAPPSQPPPEDPVREQPALPESLDDWLQEAPTAEQGAGEQERGPALWRRRPSRRFRFDETPEENQRRARNPLDYPAFFRKGMD